MLKPNMVKNGLTGPKAPPSNAIFDESGRYVLYPTLLGIKVVVIEPGGIASEWSGIAAEEAARFRVSCWKVTPATGLDLEPEPVSSSEPHAASDHADTNMPPILNSPGVLSSGFWGFFLEINGGVVITPHNG